MTDSINELKSYTEYNVSTPTSVFTIGFEYEYNVDHVNVYVDGVEATAAGYTIQHDSQGTVQLTPAVPSGVVRLSRETDIDTSEHTFSAGAKFTAGNMDENFEQIRHSQQEVRDGFSKLSDDTYAIIDTLQDVGQAAQDAADAAEQAAQTANDAAAQVNDKVSYQDLPNVIAATPHNNLADRNAVGAHLATSILSSSGENQQDINDYNGAKWRNKSGGYDLNARVTLDNGDIVKSTVAGNTVNPNVDMTGWVNPIVEATTFSNYDIVEAELTKVYLARKPITMILKTDGTDETTKIKAYLAKAKELARPLEFPSGIVTFTDTLEIDFKAIIRGQGRETTILQFKNTVPDKPAILLKRGSTKSSFSDFLLRDENANTSTGIRHTDSLSEVGSPCWKNAFTNVEVSGFAVGEHYTSANPLNGATHAHCDGNVHVNFRLSSCKVGILNQNCQAVNNQYFGLNINNADGAWLNGQTITDSNFTMIRDEAGGGINIVGVDIIGRGRLFTWIYPAGGSGLFQGSASFKAQDVRGELRSTHNGVIIEEGVHGNASSGMQMDISCTDMKFVTFGQSVDLFRFAGKCKAQFINVSPVYGTGKLTVRLYPTSGRSANTSGALADVYLMNCGKVYYEKATTSPYGTYDISSTPSVVFENDHTSSTNASYILDSLGFREMQSGGSIQQLGFGVNFAGGNTGRLVYNNDSSSAALLAGTQVKFKLPKYARPTKAFMYKLPSRFSNDVGVDVYIVKDNANWANPTSFAIATDAVLVASAPLTTNKAGYFEYPITLETNIVGAAFQSGFNTWTEGRMLFLTKGGSSFSGFFGIEYI